jgi:hypothetical protein
MYTVVTGILFPVPIMTVGAKFVLSVLTSNPGGGVTVIPLVKLLPDTEKDSDGEGVP